jgi:outer membrane receptor protein involved in Fe transport
MKNLLPNRAKRCRRYLLPTLFALATVGSAQTVPTATKTAPATEGTLVLSPFTVNTDKDKGYIAADSLLAGRLSTELLKTPSDISVLTREFIDDIGATDYLQASAYLTNTYVTLPAGQDFGAQNNFRGLGGGFPTRNYFKHNNVLDFYNVERVESARGPNALLFGDGIVGGIINTVTKQARIGRPSRQLGFRVDSEGSLRGTVDANQPLGRDTAIRVNLVKDGDRNWVDSSFKNLVGATVAATYRPWKAGEFRFEAETGDLKQNYARQNFADSLSTWNGVAFVGPATVNPAGALGVNRFTTDRLTFIPGTGLVNLLNFGNTAGSNFAIDPSKTAYIANLPEIARNLSLQPSNAYGDTRRHLLAAFYQHQWTPRLFSEIGVQFAGYKRFTYAPGFGTLLRDINTTLPGGATNPRFGKIYADAAPLLQDQDNRHYDYRVVTAYELPISWWKQTLNAMASRRVEHFFALDQRYMRTNNAAVPLLTSGANQFNVRQYLGDSGGLIPSRPLDDATTTWESIPTRYRSQRQQLDTLQLATVATAWQERLTFVGGLRHDSYASREFAIGAFSATTGRPATQAILLKELKSNVFSSGVTFFPVPQIGVYGNVSQTFSPIGAGDPSLYLKQFGQTDGLGYSGGVRFRLFNGAVVGSLGYYDTTEQGRVTGFGVTEINRIWTNLNRVEKTFPTAYRDTSDINSKGYELEAVANVTRNFRIRGNIGTPKTKQSNALPDTISYLNENLPGWTAALTNPLTTNISQINSDIAALRTRIQAGNEGRALNNQADFNGSVFGNYTFAAGALQRLSVGGGVAIIGRRIIGNQVVNAFDYIKAPAYYTLTGSFGYGLKVFQKNVRLQLNVNNLLDYSKPYYTSIRTLAGRNYRDGFYYLEPRKFLLSATIDL